MLQWCLLRHVFACLQSNEALKKVFSSVAPGILLKTLLELHSQYVYFLPEEGLYVLVHILMLLV